MSTKFDALKIKDQLLYAIENTEASVAVREAFSRKLKEGGRTEAEDSDSHLIVSFVPYDVETAKVLLVKNIGTGLWLFPGAHVHKGESLTNAVKRESKEELDLEIVQVGPPFLLTLTKPTSKKRPCKKHFDIWFLLKVERKKIEVDKEEASDFSWRSLAMASQGVTDPSTLVAIESLKKLPSSGPEAS